MLLAGAAAIGGWAAWPADPATPAPAQTLPTAEAPRETPPATRAAPSAIELAPAAVGPTTAEPTTAEPATAEPATVEIAVTTRPTTATIRLDGDVVEPPIVLPRDGREHALTIAAPGFRREHRTVVADRDQRLEVVLARQPGRRGARLPAKMREW